MNVSHEGEELKCCVQPLSHWEDPLQTKFMVSMGYRQEDIQDLLRSMRKQWSPACSWVLLSSQEVQLRVSASPGAAVVSTTCLSHLSRPEKTQRSHPESEQDQETGQKGSNTAMHQPAPY